MQLGEGLLAQMRTADPLPEAHMTVCAGHPSARKPPHSRQEELRLLSMFLAKLLRHKATQLGLRVEEGGWVMIEEVLQVCHSTSGFASFFPNFPVAHIADASTRLQRRSSCVQDASRAVL